MNAEFWNQRFESEEYVYGTQPVDFIVEEIGKLRRPASIIELGAGEGRNAVYLACQGFQVTALDFSPVGLEKARNLATACGTTLETICVDIDSWSSDQTWDAVVISFLHLPPERRLHLYSLVKDILKPGGLLIAQWFHPDQVLPGYQSGGPKDSRLMPTLEELLRHFKSEGILNLSRNEIYHEDGLHHQGQAVVVRLVWRKVVSGVVDVPP